MVSQKRRKHFKKKREVNKAKSDREVIRCSDREVTGHLRENSFHGVVESEAGLLCTEA